MSAEDTRTDGQCRGPCRLMHNPRASTFRRPVHMHDKSKRPAQTSFELDRYKAGPHGLASHAADVMVIIVMVIVGAAVIEFASACWYSCLPYMRILLSRDMQLASRHVNKRVHHALSSVSSQWLSIWI